MKLTFPRRRRREGAGRGADANDGISFQAQAHSLRAPQAPRGTAGGSAKGQAWAEPGWARPLGKGGLTASLGADLLVHPMGQDRG